MKSGGGGGNGVSVPDREGETDSAVVLVAESE